MSFAAASQEVIDLHHLNRLKLMNCPQCSASFAVPMDVLIDLHHEALPLHCPAGHPSQLDSKSLDVGAAALMEAQILID